MELKLIFALFFTISSATALNLSELIAFLKDLKRSYQPLEIDAFLCLSIDQKVLIAKELPIALRYLKFSSPFALSESDSTHFTIFLVDLECENASRFLKSSTTMQFYRHPNRWIMLGDDLTGLPDLEALTDSNILFVDKNFKLWNFYRIKSGMPYIVEEFGSWTSSKGLLLNQTSLIISRRRRNLRRVTLKATIVITHNDSLQHLEDSRDKHIDPIGKVNYVVTKHLIESLNATMMYNRMLTWGYKDGKTGNWSGMIGELTSKRSDVGGTSLFITPDRIRYIEYLSMVTPTKACFIFRRPPLSTVANIYSLPFTGLVWISCGCLVILAVTLIWITLKIHLHYRRCVKVIRISDCILAGISTICQMGSILPVKSISARITTIFLLIALLFLYTSYTANIVALLQSTAKTINTLPDLLESKIELGIHDNPYNRYYIPLMDEPIRRKLYETKILPSKGGDEFSRFMNISTGIDGVRRSLFGF